MHATAVDWVDLAQTIALVLGGAWALFTYRTARRGEVKISIEHDVRVIENYLPGIAILLIKVRLTNSSSV